MKGKALRKHSLHEKTAASVLLKLFANNLEQTNVIFMYDVVYISMSLDPT